MQTSTTYPSAKSAIGCELARFSGALARYTTASENRLAVKDNAVALAYDSTGRLGQVWTSAVSTDFDYDGAALILERGGSHPDYPIQRRYVHGPGEDQPLVWYEGAGLTDKRYLMTDERGSVVAVTTAAGAATAINSYDEYGIPASTNVGRFGYTGQTWIAELGLNYYKARMYSPTLGRFMQTDPIGYKDGVNWYDYVDGDPVNRADPTGESWSDVADIVVGVAKISVGVAGSIVGAVDVAASGALEAGTGGLATPVAVPAAAGGVLLIGASGVVAQNGTKQFVDGVKGLISENRGNRGGQGKGERGETRHPDKSGKHTKPDPNKPGNTIVNRPGAKPYSRPAREGERGYVDKRPPPVPTIPRGKNKYD